MRSRLSYREKCRYSLFPLQAASAVVIIRFLDGEEIVVLEMSLETLKSKTTFTGTTPMTERSILSALKRRQMQILSNK